MTWQALHPQVQRKLQKVTVEKDPYDVGYWSFHAGFSRPQKKGQQQLGWDRAKFEKTAKDEP